MVVEKSKIAETYDGLAKNWDELFGPAEMNYTADTLFVDLDLEKGINILDVGCGTGIALFKLYEALDGDGRFHGIDFSQGMIEQALKKAERYDNCFFKVGDAENIEYPDESFDLVVSNLLIHYLSDQSKGIAEMYRVLKPGGKMALNGPGEYAGRPMFEMMKTVAERMGFQKAADTWGWVLFNHKPVDVLHKMIEDVGFIDVKIKGIYFLNHNFDFERMSRTALLKNFRYFREGMNDQEVEEYIEKLIVEAKKSDIFNTFHNHYFFAYADKP